MFSACFIRNLQLIVFCLFCCLYVTAIYSICILMFPYFSSFSIRLNFGLHILWGSSVRLLTLGTHRWQLIRLFVNLNGDIYINLFCVQNYLVFFVLRLNCCWLLHLCFTLLPSTQTHIVVSVVCPEKQEKGKVLSHLMLCWKRWHFSY